MYDYVKPLQLTSGDYSLCKVIITIMHHTFSLPAVSKCLFFYTIGDKNSDLTESQIHFKQIGRLMTSIPTYSTSLKMLVCFYNCLCGQSDEGSADGFGLFWGGAETST